MNIKLHTLLYVIAVYLLVMGILFLFLPHTAESVFGISLPDVALNMLYGQVVLTLAYIAYWIALDTPSYGKLYSVFVALFGGHIVVFLYQIFHRRSYFCPDRPTADNFCALYCVAAFLWARVIFRFPKRKETSY